MTTLSAFHPWTFTSGGRKDETMFDRDSDLWKSAAVFLVPASDEVGESANPIGAVDDKKEEA